MRTQRPALIDERRPSWRSAALSLGQLELPAISQLTFPSVHYIPQNSTLQRGPWLISGCTAETARRAVLDPSKSFCRDVFGIAVPLRSLVRYDIHRAVAMPV